MELVASTPMIYLLHCRDVFCMICVVNIQDHDSVLIARLMKQGDGIITAVVLAPRKYTDYTDEPKHYDRLPHMLLLFVLPNQLQSCEGRPLTVPCGI